MASSSNQHGATRWPPLHRGRRCTGSRGARGSRPACRADLGWLAAQSLSGSGRPATPPSSSSRKSRCARPSVRRGVSLGPGGSARAERPALPPGAGQREVCQDRRRAAAEDKVRPAGARGPSLLRRQARRRSQRRRGDAARRAQFVYLKESFSPSLDEKLSVLYEARAAPPCRFQPRCAAWHCRQLTNGNGLCWFGGCDCASNSLHPRFAWRIVQPSVRVLVADRAGSLPQGTPACCGPAQAYGSEGRLIVNYACTPAWG